MILWKLSINYYPTDLSSQIIEKLFIIHEQRTHAAASLAWWPTVPQRIAADRNVTV